MGLRLGLEFGLGLGLGIFEWSVITSLEVYMG